MKNYYKQIQTPVGKLKLVASDQGLMAVLWEQEKDGRVRLPEAKLQMDHPILLKTETQLSEYFSKTRSRFDLPLDMQGTDFQISVWLALQKIPFGKTRSYIELAKAIDNPKASRAVGAANGKNPLSIIVPCHRVIGASGKLVGFAGGMENKMFLLELEGKKKAEPHDGTPQDLRGEPPNPEDREQKGKQGKTLSKQTTTALGTT